ncbi:MAG: hypothetical protein MIO93_06330, partial [ANME-2 cluster archaeon]|nr:hypothetical protein [ANME-2 cluster archaeon]
ASCHLMKNQFVNQGGKMGKLLFVSCLILHPCHFRYRDLTEFVYETKAKKYELLSSQMGFGDALQIQNQLKTGTNRLVEEIERFKRDRNVSSTEYSEASGEEPHGLDNFMKMLNIIFNRHDIESIHELSNVNTSFENLKAKVENDENAKKLSLLDDIKRIIDNFYPMGDIRSDISQFQSDLAEFKQDEEEISKLVLLDLYEKGIGAIESFELYEKCPLCDQTYEGNLIEYIRTKQNSLDELSKKKKELEMIKKKLLSSISKIITKIDNAITHLEGKTVEPPIIQFKENLSNLILSLNECKDAMEVKIENVDSKFNFFVRVDTREFKYILDSESKIKEYILNQVQNLENDEKRKALVDDFQTADKLQQSFLKWNRLNKNILSLEEIKAAYEKIKNDYVGDTKRSVQESFDSISTHVSAYFRTLEPDSDTLGDPKLKLYSGNDKAVELEVMFGGEPISPAYKFLSESQLNSFGLSIFLASAKIFNPDFKFIILDDVINSFDTYKRPRVIDLLSACFSDYQILLLTHDSIWLNRLQKSFPDWKRIHFLGWDYMIGPKVKVGKNTYEQIEESLLEDRPAEAGWNLGRYLEGTLQELCENLEASVKFKQRNEYSLSELLQAFQTRMKKKLNPNHSLGKQISDFEADAGFRNFCDHWKDLETDYSSSEIRGIVQKWKDIENQIECSKCHKFIRYEKVDKYEHLSCSCRGLNMDAAT